MDKQKLVLGVALSLMLLLNAGAFTYTAFVLEQVTVNQATVVESNLAVASELGALTDYLTYLSGQLLTKTGAQGEFSITVHLKAVHRREGVIIGVSEHAGTLTTIGKNYIEGKLGNNFTIASYPSAQWISLSNNASAPAAGWTEIPEEIAANNLTRAHGAYTSTGDGVWTIDYTFTASGNQAVQLAGLQWAPGSATDNNLLCADQIAAANLIANDTLELTWTITVT